MPGTGATGHAGGRRRHQQGQRRAERTVRAEAEPAAGLVVCYARGVLELARGRDADALAAFRAAERLARLLVAQHYLFPPARAHLLHALVRMGETERAEQALAEVGEHDRGRAEIRIAAAALRLAQGDPSAAAAALAPVLDGSAPVIRSTWLTQAFMLEATARDPRASLHADQLVHAGDRP